MLTGSARDTKPPFALLREREFGRLDENDVAYLDYAGSGLYGESQVNAHRALLCRSVFGNPHSAHRASADSTAAIRLVAESYPFEAGVPFVLTAGREYSASSLQQCIEGMWPSARFAPRSESPPNRATSTAPSRSSSRS